MTSLALKLRHLLLEDTSTSGTKFSTLDGLRGVAVLTVFFSHTSAANQRLAPWLNFHGTGHLGVYLFFVLSGFLLGYSLMHKPHINFRGFYTRRFFRIAPLYYLIVTLVFAAQRYFHKVDEMNLFISGKLKGMTMWKSYAMHLLFYRGNSVFWTIAAEFEFYFVLPFLVLFLNRAERKAYVALAAFAVAYFAWSLAIIHGFIDKKYALKVADIVHPTQYFDVFICGILAAYIFTNKKVHRWYERHQRLLDPLCILLALATALASAMCIGDQFLWAHQLAPQLRNWSLAYGLSFSVILLSTLYGNRVFIKIFDSLPLRIAGVVGFSWYLIHLPILRFVGKIFAGHEIEPLMWLTSLAIVVPLSIFFYLVVEKPFMMMSRSFAGKKRVPIEAAAPV